MNSDEMMQKIQFFIQKLEENKTKHREYQKKKSSDVYYGMELGYGGAIDLAKQILLDINHKEKK